MVEKSGQKLDTTGHTLSWEQKETNTCKLAGSQLPSVLKQSET